ncbi:MAG: lytic murein transglycosylase [Candidatus Pacebacteria bacterium]|nr:lytic murein transglycosylase [Candidatus Paceibacterota bacterium]
MSVTKTILFLFVTVFLVSGVFIAYPHFAKADLTADAVQKREDALKAQLAELTAEIAQKQALLDAKHGESASLQRDIALLNGKIDKAKLSIKASDLILEQLSNDIGIKSQTISTLEDRIAKNKESLADLLRKTNQTENNSLVEMILNDQSISDFVSDLDSFDSIKSSLRDLYFQITDQKQTTETEKQSLEEKSKEEADAKAILEEQKAQVELNQKAKNDLLTVTKSQEQNYALAVAQRQKQAAAIRAALFQLQGTAAIPFGTALEYANFVSQKTGVRPAFLLAILTQETNLGQNVGTCNRPGDPPSKQWKAIMPGPGDKSSRDDESAYLSITSKLGLDPDSMPLSCPWKGGWGGAMGPAQFIPTTWLAFAGRIAPLLGVDTPNPWAPKDAFMASGIYLADLGANKGGFSAENVAALKYYAGSNWYKKANAFYGTQVMAKALSIQTTMIDPLQNL